MTKDTARLAEQIRVFVLDLDGTVYLGETLIDGADSLLRAIRDSGKQYLFYTNNSSRPAAMTLDKLNRLGISAKEEELMSSVDVILAHLQAEHAGESVYLVGTPALEARFHEAGVKLTNKDPKEYAYEYGLTANARVADGERPDIVVVGFDLTLNYEKLERASAYIHAGAKFYAIHPDINCPTEYGAIPDCGAIVAAITATTGVKPRFFGKPYGETTAAIMERFHVAAHEIAFVGDRLYTDILAGVANGAKGILVLTGEAKEEDLTSGDIRPDAVFPSVKEIAQLLREQH